MAQYDRTRRLPNQNISQGTLDVHHRTLNCPMNATVDNFADARSLSGHADQVHDRGRWFESLAPTNPFSVPLASAEFMHSGQ